jgi:hypothetical protein
VIVNELKLSININENLKYNAYKKSKRNCILKKCVFIGARTQANHVAVQSPTTDLLIPCLFERGVTTGLTEFDLMQMNLFKSSWICWSFTNIWLFDEFFEFQRTRYSSNECHNKCVECVEYWKNVLNCIKYWFCFN